MRSGKQKWIPRSCWFAARAGIGGIGPDIFPHRGAKKVNEHILSHSSVKNSIVDSPAKSKGSLRIGLRTLLAIASRRAILKSYGANCETGFNFCPADTMFPPTSKCQFNFSKEAGFSTTGDDEKAKLLVLKCDPTCASNSSQTGSSGDVANGSSIETTRLYCSRRLRRSASFTACSRYSTPSGCGSI